MKRILAIAILTLLTTNCVHHAPGVGEIKIIRDDFKQNTFVRLKLRHDTQESTPSGFLGLSETSVAAAYFEYSREITASGITPTSCEFFFGVPASDPNLSAKAFLKINEKLFPIELMDIKGDLHSGTSTTTTTTGGYGYNQPAATGGANFGTGNTGFNQPNAGFPQHSQGRTVTTTSSYTYKIQRARIQFTREMERLILPAETLIYRIYYGEKFYTFEISSDDLDTLKDFLVSKGQ